jgi:Tol biopolymer transport system component
MKHRKVLCTALALLILGAATLSSTAFASNESSATENAMASASNKTSSSQGSVIVFQTSSGGVIYAMNPDGTNLRHLTTGMDPALSPDGRWVAFTR